MPKIIAALNRIDFGRLDRDARCRSPLVRYFRLQKEKTEAAWHLRTYGSGHPIGITAVEQRNKVATRFDLQKG